jgi:tryptophan synthase alpha chain
VLTEYLAQRAQHSKILLMTHIVIGYPSIEESLRLVDSMVEAGVDLMELQLPFSEPIADGPVIAGANHAALSVGVTVEQCFSFAERVASKHPIPFLFMSYYNLMCRRGTKSFVRRMAEVGLVGSIVPDLPPEEAAEYLQACEQAALAPVFIYSPRTPLERMVEIAVVARGFIYCVARSGVTGQQTQFDQDLASYVARCRTATRLPLALGFGVRERKDVAYLEGKVDIAVVGTESLRIIDQQGVDAVGGFIRSLRD